ncbi:glycosyltransferase family 4 protein [Wenjunlia tyrosinilytica]|uniref:Glycosyl transferase family 1 n=1 Tax=Wenjunlia tyrosinilytica TaxID=1544741 RepID=A0A917ZUL3_9ACTN|nr:glycosyltransferase family 4 protein [Wenjunlia tyrosinilytica]GGO96192.1 glycosyl transferase family 1 [Wenjunlia tyrosinilytica]
MHVLHVIDSVSRTGGAEQALAATAPLLVRSGVRLDIAYLLPREGLQEQLAAAGAALFCVHRPDRLRTAAALRSLIRRRRPDIVHTTLFEADLLGRAAANAARVPVVSSLVNSSYGPEHLSSPGLQPWKVRAAQAADAATAVGVRRFHALSRHVASVMAKRLAVPSHRIDVIPRGRDPELLGTATPQRRAAVRAALGLDAQTPVVLAAARQQYQKGLDVLVGCWPMLRERVDDAVLLLAGCEGAQTPKLRSLAAGDPSVVFLGQRSDVYDLMAASDAFAVPSRWEGLGSAAMEAMGVGVPLVASDVPALRETVGSEGHALLVPSERPEELHDALLDTLTHREAAHKRAAAAREHFLRHYTLEQVTAEMIAFYRGVLARGPERRL